jgi:hypothetical protein
VTDEDSTRGPRGLDDLRVTDPRALEGDPFVRRATFLSSLRASGRAWVAAGIAIAVLALGWEFRAPVSKGVAGGDPAAHDPVPAPAVKTTRLRAADPVALKQQLVDDLRAAGVEAIGYDRLGLSGVDAKLPAPLPEAARATLEKYAIGLPADGVVRVEITQSR